jgi:hydrogenase maturation protease
MLLIGVGNPWRGDDAAGLEVARRVGGFAHEGDCTGLVELWSGHDEVALVDAASSGGEAGTVHRLEAGDKPLPAQLLRSSTHAFGVADAIELARALGRLPETVRVYAIEGSDFTAGAGLSPAVQQAVEQVARELERR